MTFFTAPWPKEKTDSKDFKFGFFSFENPR